jgi:DNA-directed RNA polymerase specialized sigma24 family protein
LVESSEYTIAFDEGRADALRDRTAQSLAGAKTYEDFLYPDDSPEAEERLPLSVMSEAIAQLLAMPPRVRDVVCWRFAGMKYREIAQAQGATLRAVEVRHRRAMKKWPALRAMFAEKSAKQKRRKPHGVRR